MGRGEKGGNVKGRKGRVKREKEIREIALAPFLKS